MRKFILTISALAILFGLAADPVNAQVPACKASNVQEFAGCLTKLNAGTVTDIEVTNRISCTATAPCNFTITSNGGKIFGSVTNAGFFRTGTYDKQIININSIAKNFTITNLIFDDDTNVRCTGICVAQLGLGGSDITLDHITMNNSKQQAITAGGTNLKITNSTFSHTYSQEVWISTTTDTVLLEGNTFSYGGGSGTFIQGKNITVRGNTFEKNQWNPPWVVQGGQMLLKGATGVLVTKNKIINGYYYRHFTGGIEMDGSNANITISDNYIHANTGSGVVNDPGGVMSNVIIENNEITQNRSTLDDLSGKNNWTVRGNCYQAPCATGSEADLNSDGKVDAADYEILKGNYGKTGSGIPGDFNGNGKVDIFDYNTFMTDYQKLTVSPTPTPTPTKIVISSAGVNNSGAYASNWAVWAGVSNLGTGNNIYALLIKPNGGIWWGPLAPIFINSARNGISFFLPPTYPVNTECNLTGPCTVQLILVNYDTQADSNSYSLSLPKR